MRFPTRSIAPLLAAALSFFAGVSAHAAAFEEAAEKAAIQTLEKQRQQAYLTRDWKLLDAIIDADVQYVHSTGHVDDRAKYLANVNTVPSFLSTERVNPKLTLLSETVALYTGDLKNHIRRTDGTEAHSTQFLTQVWIKRADGWKIVLYQLTRHAQ